MADRPHDGSSTGHTTPRGALSSPDARSGDPKTGPVRAMVRKHASPLRRSRQHDRGPRTEYLAFMLGGDVYAAPVGLVREILKPPPLTPVPRAPSQVLGIVSVRGQLVTVVDLRRRLRLYEVPSTRKTRILLVDTPLGEGMGLVVDEVLQVYRLADAEIEPSAALGGEVASYIAGIARPAAGGAAARGPGAQASAGAGQPATSGPDASVVVLLDLKAVLAS